MAFQPETPTFDAGVIQLETTTPVQGGVGGASNAPLLSLSNRTAYLKQHIDNIESGSTVPPGIATLNSPAFTGSPTVPNAALGDRSTKIANTQFVQDTVYSVVVVNVAGGANVVLTAAQAGAGFLALQGALTANISVIVPNAIKMWVVANQTTGAFTLTVKTAAGTGIAVTQGRTTILSCDSALVYDTKTDFPNVALTGTPTAPTAGAGRNDTMIATTQFVQSALAAYMTLAGMAGYAPLASPALSGTPTAPTGALGRNDGMVATTAFVQSTIANGHLSFLGNPGYQKLPSGLIIQWGQALASSGVITVAFPIAFPSSVLQVVVTGYVGANQYANVGSATYSSSSLSAITLIGSIASNSTFNYIAIGV